MPQPVKLNLKIYQGSTFTQTLRWESSTKVYVPIASISKAAPMVVTTTQPHQIPVGWRTKITNVVGMKELPQDYIIVSQVGSTTLTYNHINSVSFSNYTSGGVVEYNQPVDLSNITARMQIRSKITSPDVILELTTENNRIVINNDLKTIDLNIPAEVTEDLVFKQAVYSLELINNNVVVPFSYGSVSLVTEVTR